MPSIPPESRARPKPPRARLAAAAVLLGAALLGVSLRASASAPPEGPTAAIDRLVAAQWQARGVTPSPPAGDAAFLRRVYLDLAGRIPTPAETDAFLADPAPGRRAALVDRLLAGPEYAAAMRDLFDAVLMGRGTPDVRRQRRESGWLPYLERAFAENRPWDRVLADILLARPAGAADRGAVWFLYERRNRYQEIAEAVSPAVFGVQVQCAQCHDHPLADEIKQAHYWGLVAFFNRGKNTDTRQGPRVAEAASGGFSRFATLDGGSQAAELTFLGTGVIEEQPAPEGQPEAELFRPAPEGADAAEPPVPRFSRREQFVERVVRGNPLVARAAVNRFWAHLMGRGIVHPVDRMDSAHPPSHPELLDLLARDFAASGYDVKRLLRAILLSRPYGLDSRAAAAAPAELFARGPEKPLTAESLYRSLLVAARGGAHEEDVPLLEAVSRRFPDVFPEESVSSLPQTLFLSNNPLLQRLLDAPGGTVERLAALPSPAARVREAFRVAYAREPDAEEAAAAAAYLAAREDRSRQAAAQLLWALLAGAEFRLNH